MLVEVPSARRHKSEPVEIGPASDLRPADAIAPSAALSTFGRWQTSGKYFACDGAKVVARGVTYGPFKANEFDEPFPTPTVVAADFAAMRLVGINCIRTYCVPPAWFLEFAADHQIGVLLDVPWSKHLTFLDSRAAIVESRRAVQTAAELGARYSSVLAYSIGNEIPTDVVRWHGAKRIESHLATLADVVRQADPSALVTYANFPPTEFLDLSFLDFATFNVYLHDLSTFHRYLLRLQNLVGDVPLVLGELGMDTMRHGEAEQAAFLAGHLRDGMLLGLAGAFVFSWTDDWFTGGFQVEDWAFGLTKADRTPKLSCARVAGVYSCETQELLEERPRVSVVVCSYNGAATLEQCLRSLVDLNYPDYEVILVDDGSTDDTAAIAAQFPEVRSIRQDNLGLSVARNVGFQAATGAIVAYTDSDCYADQDWLSQLVWRLTTTDAAATGGPNLSPDDGWLAASVGASPGQPTHVLESEQVAEHIPGCNMAFRREALEAINGFDPQFMKAGDDVDLCWRLQQSGRWITFAPGAFVWHHRRQTPRAYFRQQAGYGEAEALLRFKHPEKFNGRGAWKWQGVLYGASLRGLQLREPLIYRGTFGTGLFQCLYQAPPMHWAMLPSCLEWHLIALIAAANAPAYRPAGIAALVMFALSLVVALLQAAQAKIPARYRGLRSRLVTATMCFAQPIVRSWAHIMTRLSYYSAIAAHPALRATGKRWPWFAWNRHAWFWSEQFLERTAFLQDAVERLRSQRWGMALDTGWTESDVTVFGHPWSCLHVTSVQEDHGSGKRLIRIRYQLRPTWLAGTAAAALVVSLALAFTLAPMTNLAFSGIAVLGALRIWRRGQRLAAQVVDNFERSGLSLGLSLPDSEPCPEN